MDSLAQAVVAHYKSRDPLTIVIIVKLNTAAYLKTSLKNNKITSIITTNTTICGINYNTISITAWPFLRDGVDTSMIVTDAESAEAQRILGSFDIIVGPCGAAPLAALLSISKQKKEKLHLDQDAVIVLLGTEGPRGEAFDMS